MARKKVEDRPVHEQDEILEKEINPSGKGEAPAVQALLDPTFRKMSDTDALPIADALREIIRGQKMQADEMAAVRKWMAEREEASRKWQEEQEKFIQETIDKADRKLKATGETRDSIIANAAKIYEEAHKEAKAKLVTDRIAFKQKCEAAPKVAVWSPGKRYLSRRGDVQTWVVEPEVYDTNGFRFILQPNRKTMLPDFVAEEYFARKEQAAEFGKLEEQLSRQEEFSKAAALAPEIDPNYRPTEVLSFHEGQGIFKSD